MTIYRCQQLPDLYEEIRPGDIIVGDLTSAHQNSARLIDLMQRGAVCIPSPLAQVLSRSKVAQVDILGAFMLPLTMAVKRRKELLDAVNNYTAAGIGAVITKEEHMHCGHGVRKWEHIETIYSFRGLEKECYPFVMQPFVADFKDVRVIMVGDYVEAYERFNPRGFRANLSSGGEFRPHDLTAEEMRFCRRVMDRAQFPYAHLDLQIMPDGRLYILEIALNGGIQGSRLNRADLDKLKTERLDQMASALGTGARNATAEL